MAFRFKLKIAWLAVAVLLVTVLSSEIGKYKHFLYNPWQPQSNKIGPAQTTSEVDQIQDVAFDPGSHFVAVLTEREDKYTLVRWDSTFKRTVTSLRGSESYSAFAISPDTKTAALVTDSHVEFLVGASRSRERIDLAGATCGEISYSPDGKYIGALCFNPDSLRIFNSQNKELVQKIEIPMIASFQFLDGGLLSLIFLKSGRNDKLRGVWEGIGLFSMKERKMIAKVAIPNIDGAVVDPRGQLAAVIFHKSRTESETHVWDLKTKRLKKRLQFPGWSVEDLAYSPDSKKLAVAYRRIVGSADLIERYGAGPQGEVQLWDISSGSTSGPLSKDATHNISLSSNPMHISFIKGGKTLVCSDFNTLNYWNIGR